MSEHVSHRDLSVVDEAFSSVISHPVEEGGDNDPLTETIINAITQIHTGVQGLQLSSSILSDRLNALEDWVFFLLSQNPKFMVVFDYARKEAQASGQAGGVFPAFPRTPAGTSECKQTAEMLDGKEAINEKEKSE